MSYQQQTYTIQGMDCTDCARNLQNGVCRLDQVEDAEVDFSSSTMTVKGDISYIDLERRVKALGYSIANPSTQAEKLATYQHSGVIGFFRYLTRQTESRFALVGGVLIILGVLAVLLGLPGWLSDGVLVGAMLVAVFPIARSGFNTLLINRDFNINLLMTLAALGAIILGEYLESATVIFLFAVGEALEGYATDRARHSIAGLLELAPPQAIRLTGMHEEVVPVERLNVGDRILVKSGERIPMDGRILKGQSDINQAPITGESLPVEKGEGDEVFAGTLNGRSVLEIEVTHLAADNTLNRIIRLVEEAQSVQARSQRVIDRFARWYTPLVVSIAILVATVPPLLFGAPFWNTAAGTYGWFYRALALLVISCPCALVISAPVTVISSLTAAARRGVLIKGGVHLENLGTVRAFAFDKTGTLTYGEPQVIHLRSIDCTDEDTCPACEDMLALAAAVEMRSTHPLARSVVSAAQSRGLLDIYAPAENVEVLSGNGVRGRVGERTITVGSHRMIGATYGHVPVLHKQIVAAEALGHTTMLLYDDESVRGFIAVADEIRAESQQVIQKLRDLGFSTVMLTGDNRTVAQAIGAAAGVDAVRAELLPGDKVDAVRELTEAYEQVAMVGDGINDAPALATATVGIGMGGAGSAQTVETADVVLMADDLTQLPYAIRLARFARRLIQQNIVVSLAVKLAIMVLALLGGASLWMAILADVGMSLLVILNGMRPLARSRQPEA